jgi:hypothetical protein
MGCPLLKIGKKENRCPSIGDLYTAPGDLYTASILKKGDERTRGAPICFSWH